MAVGIPLSPEKANYFVTVSLEGNSYRVWLYYNERMEQWIFNLSTPDDIPVVMGVGVVPQYPMLLDYGINELTGFFYFEPIGKKINQTLVNPFEIWKYYTLTYYYDNGKLDEE